MDPVITLLSGAACFLLRLTAVGLLVCISLSFIMAFSGIFLMVKFRLCLRRKPKATEEVRIGFFHPYCDAGGGGERVLWCAIRAFKRKFPAAKFAIYTGDLQSAPDQILLRAKQRFQIAFEDSDDSIEFVYLHRRHWVEASTYPRFTLIGQSLGSIVLGYEALAAYCPDVYIDSMGYAFTLPLFKIFGRCMAASYVHYPTISTDMLDKVRRRTSTYNNRCFISNSRILSCLKLQYYKLFAFLYGCAGRFSDLTMVNSSWTEDHINHLWLGRKASSVTKNLVHKVYPPCDISEFSKIVGKSLDVGNQINIVSVGQFRPEKDHALQIRTMFQLRDILEESLWKKVKLLLIGGCRNSEDEKRVQNLKDLCGHLSVEDNVEFLVNVSFDELKKEIGEAVVGLHTMWNEHFGIAVVEMLAAGLMTIAHRSGGPLMDIIVEDASSRNGYLATHEKEYAATIAHILTGTSQEERQKIRERARDSVRRFSDQQFEKDWIRTTETLFRSAMTG